MSYSHKDEQHRAALEAALSTAVRLGELEIWSDHRVLPGEELDEVIMSQLKTADVVLLLISPDFIASDYCYTKELRVALERHQNRRAAVVPIVVRPTDWSGTPFAKLLMLPIDAKAVTAWSDPDEAWLSVAKGIRRLLRDPFQGQSERNVFSSKALNQRLADSFDSLATRFSESKYLGDVPFGIPALDNLTNGLEKDEMTLLASRPEHGQVELALAVVSFQASMKDKKKKSIILSQRLSATQYANRLLCSLGVISRARFSRGQLEEEDWSRVTSAVRILKDADVTIDDDPVRSAQDLMNTLDRLRGTGAEILVIDGIEYTDKGGQEREISLALSDFAKQEKVAVLITLALGSNLDLGANRRPSLLDIGSWRDLADVAGKVILCHREYENSLANLKEGMGLSREVEVSLVKSHEGAKGKVALKLDEESGAIYDPEMSHTGE
ncbi:DnaB-like helicase C-terminal domain-containing protein [Luteimonas sp. RD2P54]|uniref:DnaB-like helicase C-terminal domain-containing protein n=1 Tax=Luteimonas endophytica TaxID=3042023 RepID=A0ABT6JDN6_9GAMM|nr:DnaB-like helicase C-terminal domain-containing protein [Luteimonas endophytica]MDH5824942.1 DnaB-like helicase C-terminal domain-containing protein [Luteimonas endophytica]